MDVHVDGDVALFVRDKIYEVKAKHRISMAKLGVIMGYERAALHRRLRDAQFVRLESLYRLSQYLGLPMSYWFPPVEVEPVVPSEAVVLSNLIKGETGLTKRVMKAVTSLPAVHKYDLLNFLNEHPELLSEAVLLVKELVGLDAETRQRLHSAIKTITQEKRRPTST